MELLLPVVLEEEPLERPLADIPLLFAPVGAWRELDVFEEVCFDDDPRDWFFISSSYGLGCKYRMLQFRDQFVTRP